jgi:hypothetical protein
VVTYESNGSIWYQLGIKLISSIPVKNIQKITINFYKTIFMSQRLTGAMGEHYNICSAVVSFMKKKWIVGKDFEHY